MTGSEPTMAEAEAFDVEPAEQAAQAGKTEPAPEPPPDRKPTGRRASRKAVEAPEPARWHRGETGRWIVGDPGRQAFVDPLVSGSFGLARPDTVVDGGRLGQIRFRGAALRGTQHQEHGTPRQDAFLLVPSRNLRWLVGCVADGVSQAKRSHEAADLACEQATQVLAQEMPDESPSEDEWPDRARALPWQPAVDAVNQAIMTRATAKLETAWEKSESEENRARLQRSRERGSVSESEARKVMATTAIAFVVASTPNPDGAFPFAVTVLAGDSAAAVLAQGIWTPWTAVKNENAEVASSAVQPLPMPVTPIVRTGYLSPGDGLAIYTDGIGDPLGTGQGRVGEFLAEVWRQPPELLDFAQQVGFLRKSFADDRTAVMVWAGG